MSCGSENNPGSSNDPCKPWIVYLEEGDYKWCGCGKSTNQALCDNSRRSEPHRPKPFHISTSGKVALCRCRRTSHAPFCDGSHN